MTNPIMAKFANAFDCPVHGVRVIRLPGHRFRLELTPPVEMPAQGGWQPRYSGRDAGDDRSGGKAA